ncbi:MAG: HAD family hydrolase [Planctomycetota bacterium]
MRLSAVIFDLDDTLFPERSFVRSGMRSVAGWLSDRFGFETDRVLTEFDRLEVEQQGRLFDAWIELHDVAIQAGELVSVYRSHAPTIQPFPDAKDVLETLKSQGYRLGLVSDGYLETQQNKFDALGLHDYFERNAVVFSDQFGREHWKPSSKPFEVSLNALGVEGSEAVYVGDNPTKDFKGARSVGMKSIRVTTIGGVYAKSRPLGSEYEPDIDVNQLYEILDAIKLLER